MCFIKINLQLIIFYLNKSEHTSFDGLEFHQTFIKTITQIRLAKHTGP